MPKVITYSTVFPSYHPMKGQPTYFVEKLIEWWFDSYSDNPYHNVTEMLIDLNGDKFTEEEIESFVANLIADVKEWKSHTIRGGYRFKEGDIFSPRVWIGKPYNSKQLRILPDIKVKKTWNIEIKHFGILDQCLVTIDNVVPRNSKLPLLANNDGLSLQDFNDWFVLSPSFVKLKEFNGQIICWNDKIEY